MIKILKNFLKNQSGATAMEYGLIGALIFIVIVASATLMGEKNSENWNYIAESVDNAT